MGGAGTRCPSWCNDHMYLGGLDYHQSREREVNGYGLILFGPDTGPDPQPGGLFILPTYGGPMEGAISPDAARQMAILFRAQADRLTTLASSIDEAADLVEDVAQS